MLKTLINAETGEVVYLDSADKTEDTPASQEVLDTMAEQITTLQNNDSQLGDQVQGIQGTVNTLSQTAVTLTGAQTVDGKTLTNSAIKDTFRLEGDTSIGQSLDISFIGGTAQLATNNGLDILADTNFLVPPSVENPVSYSLAVSNNLITKQQVAEALSNVTGAHFDKWVIMGTPQPVTLDTSLKKITFPTTTRFPSLPPESMELNQEGNGLIFKKPGLIHVKRNVSLGGSNINNLYYQARINDQTLEPLQTQAVSISENTMSFSIEFYWQVTANQEFSIWGNCLSGEMSLNYKGVCMLFEYL